MSSTELRAKTEAGTVEVRVRHADAAEGLTLGWFPILELQRITDEILRWGIYDEDGAVVSNMSGSLSGQFNLDSTACYFELIVNPEDE